MSPPARSEDEAGDLRFSELMERALYDPETGFYETGGRAGRREGAFLTSPEVGPLYGAVVAQALDRWWRERGRPDPYVVEDHGAGPGTLARTLLAAAPECAPALRIVAVERSAAQRALHPDHLPHVGDLAAGPPRWDDAGAGPLVASAAEPPEGPVDVVWANELLDNLPFDILERTAAGWAEVRVRPESDGGRWAEALHPASPDDVALLDALAPHTGLGCRVPVQRVAGEWLAGTLARVRPGGRLVVVDYAGATTLELAHRPDRGWLRTYRAHGRGADPLWEPGRADITADVALDQLARRARPPDQVRSQADALRAWGIEELVARGRAAWAERTGPADLAALRARSRAVEAEALLDPHGLGAHHVAEWVVPRPGSYPPG